MHTILTDGHSCSYVFVFWTLDNGRADGRTGSEAPTSHLATSRCDINKPRCEKPGLRGFRPGPTQTGLYNQKMARVLKFRILVEEVLCYPGSENKGADQLRGYREADLRLCFRVYAKSRFSHVISK